MENYNLQNTLTYESEPPNAHLEKFKNNWFGILVVFLLSLPFILFIVHLVRGQETLVSKDTTSNQQSITVQAPTNPPSETPLDWKTYSDSKYKYSFNYPPRYQIESPTQEAIPEGEVLFNAGSKADRFWVDAVIFNGTLDEFVDKYTEYDQVTKIVETNLNVYTPLGESIYYENPAIRFYKHTTSNGSDMNSGAGDIISYTAFFVSKNFGYIFRSANITDNLSEVSQILTTFKFVEESKETSNWKKYEDRSLGVLFSYPPSFSYDSKVDPYFLISSNPLVKISIHFVGNPVVLDECLENTEKQTLENLTIKKYQRTYEKESCGQSDVDRIVVVSSSSSKDLPAVVFSYDSSKSSESEKVINQIINTLQFTE